MESKKKTGLGRRKAASYIDLDVWDPGCHPPPIWLMVCQDGVNLVEQHGELLRHRTTQINKGSRPSPAGCGRLAEQEPCLATLAPDELPLFGSCLRLKVQLG
ncbi:uncharacterized protein CLUP02_06918 [Colletotrichum lupini]|uniref:Uncharacterized protein n=1 Tax=Colletotrichum lupini TaxID=145971 RepID=A0A9Q8SQ07_9PEZI|nr:uncharacterized protein CLUP02_06918 [Colletotrichum lupini]UQC81432.1 hypothetical protein CLUP02_06918 [Colletotrichum lupini]